MITQSDLIATLGALTAGGQEAECSALCIARKGHRWLEERRAERFGPSPVVRRGRV